MGIRICPKCGGKVSDSRDICIHCGYTFVKQKQCPECLEYIDENLNECPVCGYLFANSSTENTSISATTTDVNNNNSFVETNENVNDKPAQITRVSVFKNKSSESAEKGNGQNYRFVEIPILKLTKPTNVSYQESPTNTAQSQQVKTLNTSQNDKNIDVEKNNKETKNTVKADVNTNKSNSKTKNKKPMSKKKLLAILIPTISVFLVGVIMTLLTFTVFLPNVEKENKMRLISDNEDYILWLINIDNFDLAMENLNDEDFIINNREEWIANVKSALEAAKNRGKEDIFYYNNKIYFGVCEQDGDETTEDVIEWDVIAEEGNKCLIVSHNILFSCAFDDADLVISSSSNVTDNNYSDSVIRTVLNQLLPDFLFNSDQQKKILTTTVDNNGYCEDTEDKIFLLSYWEANYLGYEERIAPVTEYIKNQWEISCSEDVYSSWWLRTPSDYDNYHTLIVDASGTSNTANVQNEFGIRPAMWIEF